MISRNEDPLNLEGEGGLSFRASRAMWTEAKGTIGEMEGQRYKYRREALYAGLEVVLHSVPSPALQQFRPPERMLRGSRRALSSDDLRALP